MGRAYYHLWCLDNITPFLTLYLLVNQGARILEGCVNLYKPANLIRKCTFLQSCIGGVSKPSCATCPKRHKPIPCLYPFHSSHRYVTHSQKAQEGASVSPSDGLP